MINKTKGRDYFSFESINDHEGNLVCYHVTMIGTIEADGLPRIRSDMGQDGTKKMTFGKITLRGCDRKIGILLRETDSKVEEWKDRLINRFQQGKGMSRKQMRTVFREICDEEEGLKELHFDKEKKEFKG